MLAVSRHFLDHTEWRITVGVDVCLPLTPGVPIRLVYQPERNHDAYIKYQVAAAHCPTWFCRAGDCCPYACALPLFALLLYPLLYLLV